MRRRARWCAAAVSGLVPLLATGTAGAAPPAGPAAGAAGSTGYAYALLSGPTVPAGGTAESFFGVYAPAGMAPFGRGEVFVGGYECLTADAVPARVSGLDTASATGVLHYDCGSPSGSVRGSAVVHLRWTGQGEVTETSWTDDQGCVVTVLMRSARLTGGMVATVAGVGVSVLRLNGPTDADIRQERITC